MYIEKLATRGIENCVHIILEACEKQISVMKTGWTELKNHFVCLRCLSLMLACSWVVICPLRILLRQKNTKLYIGSKYFVYINIMDNIQYYVHTTDLLPQPIFIFDIV